MKVKSAEKGHTHAQREREKLRVRSHKEMERKREEYVRSADRQRKIKRKSDKE